MTSKNDGTLVVFMIIALIAFCVGAGIGVSMVISDDGADVANNTTHIENVTHEMTTNLTYTMVRLAPGSALFASKSL